LWIAVVFAIILGCAASAQQLQPPPGKPVVLDASQPRILLGDTAQVACDARGDMALEAAEGASFETFRPGMTASSACKAYWVRFSVESGEPDVHIWVFQLLHPWLHADLYAERNGAIAVEHTGTALPPQNRALISSYTAFALAIKPGEPQVFYLHLVGNTARVGEARTVDATFFALNEWVGRQRSVLFGQGIYAGVIAGLALYNLILFLLIRERVYLYYVLYVTCFGAIWIARSNFLYQYLWPQHPDWNAHYLPYVAAAAIVFSVMFVREFLATRSRSLRADLAMKFVIGATAASCVVGLAGWETLFAECLAALGLGTCVLYAVVGVRAAMQGYRPARFFLVAWTALLVGNIIYILMFLRVIPMTFVTYNAAQAGSAVECLLLAFALADRVNLLKRAREERQLEYMHDLQEQVRQRTGELSDAVERLKTASATDPLTGLSNRRHVEAAIGPWIAELQRARIRNVLGEPRRYLVICLADLDHFKVINDGLGHVAGDRVLRAAAATLLHNVRATAMLARWGGEEFLIVDRATAPNEDLLMAERLRCAIATATLPVMIEKADPLTLSLGLVRYPFSEAFPDLLEWEHCLTLADHALYRSKRSGRNCWRCYRSNDAVLAHVIRERGKDEVQRILQLHADEAFNLGLIDIVERVPADVEVV
jgi:diguanylate cyclase (GGDEF)-like protein